LLSLFNNSLATSAKCLGGTAINIYRNHDGLCIGSALRAYALTLPPIGFALRSVQTHISKQFCIEMCVYTLLKANPMGRRVRAYALKGKINFTSPLEFVLHTQPAIL